MASQTNSDLSAIATQLGMLQNQSAANGCDHTQIDTDYASISATIQNKITEIQTNFGS